MDTNITGFSPAPPRLDAAGHPRATLPGEAPEPRGDEAHTAAPGALLSGPVASVPARPRRRTALLAGAGMLGVAVAGGAFLFSPYNTFVPVDTGRLGSQARQLAASAGLPVPPVVAPAAKLATAPRREAGPVYREGVGPRTPDEQLAEIQGFRRGAAAEAGEGRPEGAPATPPPRAATVAQAASTGVAGEVGAGTAPAPTPRLPVSLVPRPAAAPVAEPGAPSLAVQASATAAPSPAPAPAPLAPTTAAPSVLPESPVTAAPVQPDPAPAAPRPAAPVPAPADPVALAVELRPAPLTRTEQVEVLNLVTRLGVVLRDLRAENAALRADQKATAERVDTAVADFERRLLLAEARGAMNAAMGIDPGPATAPTSAPTVRAGRPLGAPVQPVGVQVQTPGAPASAPAAGGPQRWRVTAASPGLAMLSELDRSGGEGSQIQVQVGDQVPGHGKITAIQQRGTAWVVKTAAGDIQ